MVIVLRALAVTSAVVAACAKVAAQLLATLPPRGARMAEGYDAAARHLDGVALWMFVAAGALALAAVVASRRRWSRWAYPVAWEPLGFARAEARRWTRWRFRPMEAQEQRGLGRTPPEAAVACRLLEGSPVGALLAAAAEASSGRAGEAKGS